MPTRRGKYALRLIGIVAALLIVWFLWLSKGTPPGQPPLTSLTPDNFQNFRQEFNSNADRARLVLLLSPT
ncbi:MAG: hypothetical protein WCB11_25665 [Terriglobales bacterium]